MAGAPISVEEAICRVIAATQPLGVELLPISTKLIGRTLAQPLVSDMPFPHFRASIMDGYAVSGPLEPGIYRVAQHMHAGDSTHGELKEGEVSYIATGAKLPDSANAVVKIEETSKIGGDEVEIKVAVKAGDHVRQIGSDIQVGEEVLAKGTVLGPVELGLLATTGFTSSIPCYRRPIVGVMSTGNELVECTTPDSGLGEAKIRDSNRITLLASFLEAHYDVVDYGIIPDDLDVLRAKLSQACAECDVLITSGGVSMGNKDYVKFLLLQDAEFSPKVSLHFNKLNMKPGKPTTFATIHHSVEKDVLFFGLPGNPVSCSVTKTLFVDVALRRLQGLSAQESLHSEVTVTLVGDKPLVLDAERPEYHRVSIFSAGNASAPGSAGKLYACSTGNQRSSRLLSMKSANGLLYLPQGPGVANLHKEYRALLIGSLPVPLTAQDSMHAVAARADNLEVPKTRPELALLQQKKVVHASSCVSNPGTEWKRIRVGILTISDRAAMGTYQDESGPEIARILSQWMEDTSASTSSSADTKPPTPYPLQFVVTKVHTVPDSADLITSTVLQWTSPDRSSSDRESDTVDLLLTTGGTGFGPRDRTPEAINPLLHRPAPGIAQALLNEGLRHTPLAVLARPVAGTRHATFVATLPGSVKAVRENLVALKPLLPRIMELLKTPADQGLYSSHGVHTASK